MTRRRSGSRDAAYTAGSDDRQLSGRRGRQAARDDDEEDTADGETASRGSRRRGADRDKPAPTSGGRGWASHKKNTARTKRGYDNPDEFRVAEEDTTYLIKMLGDEPFWSYCEHFLNEISEGKRSFVCGGDECPLCDYGDTPRVYDLFDLAVWEPDANDGQGGWVHKYWRATPDPAGKIEIRAEELGGGKNPKALGDDDVYLAVSKSKTGKRKGGRSFNEFQVDTVKERDLEEDYDADPLTDEDFDEFTEKPFDESVVPATSLKELRAAVEALDE